MHPYLGVRGRVCRSNMFLVETEVREVRVHRGHFYAALRCHTNVTKFKTAYSMK